MVETKQLCLSTGAARRSFIVRASGNMRLWSIHPQLDRFRAHAFPRSAINAYLAVIHSEATARGYSFDRHKIGPLRIVHSISVTTGQISYEWQHLLGKLCARSRVLHRRWRAVGVPTCHPLFTPVLGPIELWERIGRGVEPSLRAIVG